MYQAYHLQASCSPCDAYGVYKGIWRDDESLNQGGRLLPCDSRPTQSIEAMLEPDEWAIQRSKFVASRGPVFSKAKTRASPSPLLFAVRDDETCWFHTGP